MLDTSASVALAGGATDRSSDTGRSAPRRRRAEPRSRRRRGTSCSPSIGRFSAPLHVLQVGQSREAVSDPRGQGAPRRRVHDEPARHRDRLAQLVIGVKAPAEQGDRPHPPVLAEVLLDGRLPGVLRAGSAAGVKHQQAGLVLGQLLGFLAELPAATGVGVRQPHGDAAHLAVRCTTSARPSPGR